MYRDDLGGIKGSVARVVERIKAESAWTSEVGRALRRAFLKLVRVNEDGQFIRQPCRWADLPDLAAPILEAFVKARLLSSNGDVVEVTHESLFRVWPELAGWLDEGRELMLWKKNIQDDVKDWIAHDRSPLYLLSGARVAEGRRWLASNADDFAGPEGEFIAASITAEDKRIAHERSQQEKLRWLARCLAVAAVVASLMGFYAIVQRNEADAKAKAALEAEAKEKSQRLIAEKATRVATSRRLAALSVAARDDHYNRSLLLAVEALRAENTLEARESLYRLLHETPGFTSYLHLRENFVRSIAFSPDGKTLAAEYLGRDFGGVVTWDAVARKLLADNLPSVEEGNVTSVAISPDGKTLAAGYGDGGVSGVVLWDAAARKRLADGLLPVKEGFVKSVAFSPDGKTLAAGYSGRGFHFVGGVVLWDVAARQRIVDEPLAVKEGDVEGVAFSPDGKTLAAGYGVLDVDRHKVGGVVLWDVAARKRLADKVLAVNAGFVKKVAFSPDGKTLAVEYNAHEDGNEDVVLWDVAPRKRMANEPGDAKEGTVGSVASVIFSPNGKTLAVGYSQYGVGGVALWDVAARKQLIDEPLSVREGDVEGVAFSPDGKTLAAGFSGPVGSNSGGVVLWDVAARKRLVDELLAVKEGFVKKVAFSPDGQTLAVGCRTISYDRRSPNSSCVVLWDVTARKRLVDKPLSVKQDYIESVAFSPDGKIMAAGCYGHGSGVVLWDVASCKRLVDERLPVNEGDVKSVAFSPDGKTLAAGYTTPGGTSGYTPRRGIGGVVLWNVADCKRMINEALSVKEGGVDLVAFSPNGKTLAAGWGGYHDRNGYVPQGFGGVVLWDLDLASWQRRAGRIATRNLTQEEWHEYFPETPYHATFPDLPAPPEKSQE